MPLQYCTRLIIQTNSQFLISCVKWELQQRILDDARRMIKQLGAVEVTFAYREPNGGVIICKRSKQPPGHTIDDVDVYRALTSTLHLIWN